MLMYVFYPLEGSSYWEIFVEINDEDTSNE